MGHPPRTWPRILLLIAPLLLAGIGTIACGYEGLNGQDAHDYLRMARGWTAWMAGGARPVTVEHPHGYPIAGALLGAVVGGELTALRLLSAVSFIVVLLVFRSILRRAFPEQPGVDLFLLLTLGACPFLLRHALMVMSDVPGIALVVLCYAAVLRGRAREGRAWYVLAVVFAALAVSVRFATLPLVLLLGLAVVHGGREGRARRWAGVAALVVAGVCILVAWMPVAELRELAARSPVGDWSVLNVFRRELVSDDGVLRYAVPNILYVLGILIHPGFLPIGIFLWPFVRRADLRPLHARLALLLLAGYLLFLAGMPFQNDRVLLLGQPFAAILLFPAFTRAVQWITGKGIRRTWAVAAVLAVQAALFVRAMLPFINQAAVERTIAEHVRTSHVRHVYTHGMGAAFADLCPEVEVTELWYGVLDRFEPGAAIVVRPEEMDRQWQGLPPAINWQRAQAQGLDSSTYLPDGWVMARVR